MIIVVGARECGSVLSVFFVPVVFLLFMLSVARTFWYDKEVPMEQAPWG